MFGICTIGESRRSCGCGTPYNMYEALQSNTHVRASAGRVAVNYIRRTQEGLQPSYKRRHYIGRRYMRSGPRPNRVNYIPPSPPHTPHTSGPRPDRAKTLTRLVVNYIRRTQEGCSPHTNRDTTFEECGNGSGPRPDRDTTFHTSGLRPNTTFHPPSPHPPTPHTSGQRPNKDTTFKECI
jgi:hypothetical protein